MMVHGGKALCKGMVERHGKQVKLAQNCTPESFLDNVVSRTCAASTKAQLSSLFFGKLFLGQSLNNTVGA